MGSRNKPTCSYSGGLPPALAPGVHALHVFWSVLLKCASYADVTGSWSIMEEWTLEVPRRARAGVQGVGHVPYDINYVFEFHPSLTSGPWS